MKKTTLLTHGYFLHDDPKEATIMRPYPPLGILYISAFLNQHDIPHELYDTTFSSKEKLKQHILNSKPAYLAIYTNLMTKLNVLEIIQFIRNHSNLSEIKIILGGPEVKYSAENFLKAGSDFIVIGEGEQTTLELINELNKDKPDFTTIHGIAFKQKEQIIYTAERSKLKNIDELPFPNREGIDLFSYLEAWKKFHGKNAISISTMRGCPYTCKWCSRAVYGLSYRRRSAKNVVDEMVYIKKTYNPDSLWFVDDVFTISHKWLNEFNEELKKRNIKIPYECITRADRMNEEVIQQMKESGCFRVWIGAESGSQRIIDLMDRRVDVHQVREMIRLVKKNEIEAGTFIMLGYPGETKKDIEETIQHLKESNPDHFTITVAYPIRGTELYQEIESKQLTNLEWDKSTDRDIDFKRTYSRRYYHYAIARVVNEVHFYKNKLKKRYSIRTALFKLKSIAAKLGMSYISLIKN